MIGVFDSGLGGLAALGELHRLLPKQSTLFLADRENAPYGTKSESELVHLVSEDVLRLMRAGAERILVGCCTACTVLDMLDDKLRRVCTPIIEPAVADAISVSRCGKIAVLCTEVSKRRAAFEAAAYKTHADIEISAFAAQPLVALVEAGLRDGCVGRRERQMLCAACEGAIDSGADTLILGCTHFSHLENTLGEITGMKTVSAASSGARHFARMLLGKE